MLCSSCKKYFHNNKWTSYSKLKDAITKITKDSIKEIGSFAITPVLDEIQINPGIKEEFDIEIKSDDEIFLIPAELEVTYCNHCSKQQGDYFEGTLQLRKVPDELLEYVYSYIKKNNIFIAKEKKQPNGMDITISDQRKIQNLGQYLQKNFGGILKISPQVHTRDRQTSKDVHRVNVYYEAPNYIKGDVVKVEDKMILVNKISKTLSGLDLISGRKTTVNLQDKEYAILKPMKTTVSKISPNLEVLHPETYQSTSVLNKKKVRLGEKVKVVDDDGRMYVL